MRDGSRRPRTAGNAARTGSLPGAVLGHLFGQAGYRAVGKVDVDEEEADDDGSGDDDAPELNGNRAMLVDIPEDAYGGAILAFVKDVPVLFNSSDPGETEYAMWNCAFSLLLLLVNLFLQLSILAYVFHYVVALDIAEVQDLYRNFRLKVFDPDGSFLDTAWATYGERADLCQIAMWNRPFYYAVLFCWSLVMMIEIRRSEELTRQIMSIPSCAEAASMLLERGEHTYVVAFTHWTRFMLIISVAIPKVAISLVLLWLGCEWLSATIKFESLVMNTVAMAFIVNIDEILFEAVLPPVRREEVQNIDFLIEKPDDDDRGLFAKRRRAYKKALICLLGLLSFVVTYAEYFQDVLPPDIRTLRNLCEDYLFTKVQPLCNGWTWYLRGNPSAHECFPFPAPPTSSTLAPPPPGWPG